MKTPPPMRFPISVTIPCYRCATTIPRALESVAKQTVLPEEVVLVDDGSRDQTLDTLRALAERYRDILAIKIVSLPENRGVAVARNTGWDHASEPFIALLDADDTWHPRKLEIQFQWMQAHPEIALSGHYSVPLQPGQSPEALPDKWSTRLLTKRELLLSNRIPTRSVILRRDIPYRFDPTQRYAEDFLLWLRIVSGNYAFALLELTLANSYKSHYGDNGLSSHLWKMEKGELNAYRLLRRSHVISTFTAFGLMTYSLVKYLRRLLIVNLNLPNNDRTDGS